MNVRAIHSVFALTTAVAGAGAPGPLRDARFVSPMPGGTVAGYDGDTGLDIGGRFLPVYALAAGTLDYSERGHTVWTKAPDTPNSVRIALDAPIEVEVGTGKTRRKRLVTHVYYTHLSELAFAVPECTALPCPPRVHVDAKQRLGVSGIGNGSPHLHVGLLLDGDVSQSSWEFILRPSEVRALLGGYKNGERL